MALSSAIVVSIKSPPRVRTMSDIGLCLTQSHRSDETLHLYGLAGEVLSNECCLVDKTLPTLSLVLSSLQDLEHLVLCNSADLWQRNRVLCSTVLAAILDSTAERLGILLTLAVEQVCGQSTLLDSSIVLLLDVALVVRLERLLELHLLAVALGVVKLGLQTVKLLRVGRRLVHLTRGSLTPGISGLPITRV